MSDQHGKDFDWILSGGNLFHAAGSQEPEDSEQPRQPVSRRERIAAMHEQARADQRRMDFRYGLLCLAALVAIAAAAIILTVVH